MMSNANPVTVERLSVPRIFSRLKIKAEYRKCVRLASVVQGRKDVIHTQGEAFDAILECKKLNSSNVQ
jgi:hypothetical protein